MLRVVISGRSADCGHAGPPLFNGINLSKTDTMDTDHITDTSGVLVACAVCRLRYGHRSGPRLHTPLASHPTRVSRSPWPPQVTSLASRSQLRVLGATMVGWMQSA